MSNIGLSLKGQFKFDLYDKSGNLKNTSNYVDNFITKTGVFYPIHFAFADCFRFLSVGDGNAPNSIQSIDETTGLNQPLEAFSYIGSRDNYYDAESTNYSLAPSCGYRFPSGNMVELYRMWTLPNNLGGDLGSFQNDGIFKEFMVSPGRPFVIDSDGKKLCSCIDFGNGAYGLDCSAISEYYNWVNSVDNKRLKICDGDKAFARIVNTINYSSGDILNVTYKLSIIIDSGVHFASLSKPNSNQQDSNWNSKLNAIYNITNPGIKLINDGEPKPLGIRGPQDVRLQHYDYGSFRDYDFTKEYGESFIPPHGMPLEPSCIFYNTNPNNENIIFYLSEDNIQFLVSSSGGAFEKTGEFAPWNIYNTGRVYRFGDFAYSGNFTYKYINQIPNSNKSLNDLNYWQNLNYLKVVTASNSGLKPFANEVEQSINNPFSYWNLQNKFNIRIEKIDNIDTNNSFPDTGNILDTKRYPEKLYYISPNKSQPITTYGDRNGKITYIFNFRNFSQASNLQAKSLVGAYKDVNQSLKNYVPFLDLLFSGFGNESIFAPKIITGTRDYGDLNNTGAYISGADNKEYFYLSNVGNAPYPIFTTALSWSVPCPQGVNGC